MEQRAKRIEALMEEALTEIGLQLDGQAMERFVAFDALLQEGNRQMNLTGLTLPEEVVWGHYVDALLPLLSVAADDLKGRVMDVGTGAGFPGIPLLIARPDLELCLVDALQKRCAFLEDSLARLGLRARVLHARAEDLGRGEEREGCDLAIARAVAPLPVLLEYLAPLVRQEGVLWCYKGPGAAAEILQAEEACALLKIETCDLLPLLSTSCLGVRSLVRCRKGEACPAKYPRKAGKAEKQPLGLRKTVQKQEKR